MNNRVPKINAEKHRNVNLELLEGLETELHSDMSDDELDTLVSRLTQMPRILPDEHFVEEVLARWQHNKTAAVSPTPLNFQRTVRKMNVWEKLKVVISHGDFTFLWYGLVFYLAGFILLQNSTNLPTVFILPIIAAIPFLLGVISTVRWFEHGVLELMMSLKLKLVWYMNARFLIIGIYSLLLNTVLTFILSGRGIDWDRLALYWLIPCVLTASIAMWLCAWVRDFRSLVCSYALLPVLCMLFYGERPVQRLLLEIDTGLLGIVLAATLIFFAVTVTATTNRIRNGGMVFGTRT